MNKKTEDEIERLLDNLSEALGIEYTMIIHYPRLVNILKDKETRELASKLGTDSLRHVDIVAKTIKELGREPNWSFEPFPDEIDFVRIFQEQLRSEELALKLHRQNAAIAPSLSLRETFRNVANDEENHIEIVRNILSRLTQHATSY